MKHIKLFESWLNRDSISESTISSTFIQEVKDALEKENFTLKFHWGKDTNEFAIFNKSLFFDSLEDFKKLNGSHCKIIHENGNQYDYVLGNTHVTVRDGVIKSPRTKLSIAEVKLDDYIAKFEPGNVDDAVSKIKYLYLKEAYAILLGGEDIIVIPNDIKVPPFMKNYTLPVALAKYIFNLIEFNDTQWDFWSTNVPGLCEIASPLLLAIMEVKLNRNSKCPIQWVWSLHTSFQFCIQRDGIMQLQKLRIDGKIKNLKDFKYAYIDSKRGKKIQFSPEIELTCTERRVSYNEVPVVIKDSSELLKMIGSEDQEFSDALKWALSLDQEKVNNYMEKYSGRIAGKKFGL